MVDQQQRRDFEIFVATRSASLMRTAYLLTGNRSDAEDLLQTTLAKVFLAWSRIDDRNAVDAYAKRTMATTQISFWRRRKVVEISTDNLPEAPVTEADEFHDELWTALQALP